ncbi:FG-GAP repeat protein [Fibrisoma limi BUZ 3]|uniref:FG-GAP repeat protein n=1 Tax=Fibrisoma limi BUZ 3 TaxID=1185876 RepID=I2GPT3_9BACT|nr:T9SS type A sorting domain-containing protein [Fibrisoma limi]CCH55911.1 FG-GAP repeat protein [Fibrisoma limi BUZ 3]
MKKRFTLLLFLLPFCIQTQSGAQTTFGFRYDLTPSVSIDGRMLRNPWAGGLNATQYSTVHLNGDAREDLVVYDRTTNKISTFVAVENPAGGIAWQYAPEYEAAFPRTFNWLQLVDYDMDGKKDLFVSGTGLTPLVYRNDSQNGQVKFAVKADTILAEGFSGIINLYIAPSDKPAIVDYDDDGDVDILAYDVLGNFISYFQNMSMERTKKPGLDFKRIGLCWGRFSSNQFCNDFVFGIQCGDDDGQSTFPSSGRVLHTGNTVTVIDTDGDGKKDLLLGHVSCQNISRLRSNGPNNEKAAYIGFDSLFPAQQPIILPAFPSTFWEDVDGDGVKDLLASPNVSFNEGQLMDFRASGWYYKNQGTNQLPDFRLVQKDFLQNDMLDLGESAAPALADLDGDGDVDLLVGYSGERIGTSYRAGLWYFENKGTPAKPAFERTNADYLGIRQSLALSDVVPAFTDVDGNGSLDLVLTGVSQKGVEIRVLFNQAGPGAAARYDLAQAQLWPTPDFVGPGDLPTITDVDRDGRPDLLIGKAEGTIQYYRNTGTPTSPSLQLQNQQFGGFKIDTETRARSLVLSDLNGDRINELVAATNSGQVRIYRMPDRPDQPLTLLDSLPGIGLPGTGLRAALADLDGDQLPDLMLGSLAGGIRYLKNSSQKQVVTALPGEEITQPWAYPNPTNRYLTVRTPYDGRIELVSMSGQLVRPSQAVWSSTETIVDLGTLPDGMYFLRLQAENRPVRVQKIVVWK